MYSISSRSAASHFSSSFVALSMSLSYSVNCFDSSLDTTCSLAALIGSLLLRSSTSLACILSIALFASSISFSTPFICSASAFLLVVLLSILRFRSSIFLSVSLSCLSRSPLSSCVLNTIEPSLCAILRTSHPGV